MGSHRLPLCRSQKVAAQPHKPAGRYVELEMRPVPSRLHMYKCRLAPCRYFDSLSDKFFRNIYGQVLDRLAPLAVDGLVQHLGLTDLKLETLASHCLYKHRQVEHSPSVDDKRIRIGPRFHPESQILLKFLLESLLQMP